MLLYDDGLRRQHEKLLVEAVRDVVSELLLIDLTQLICCVGTNRMASVEILIDSATELYFKPGCLKFSKSGVADVSWTGSIKLSLDFEFDYDGVRIYFTIMLQPRMAAIQINYLWLGENGAEQSGDQRVRRTAAALVGARSRPVTNQLAWWRVKPADGKVC